MYKPVVFLCQSTEHCSCTLFIKLNVDVGRDLVVPRPDVPANNDFRNFSYFGPTISSFMFGLLGLLSTMTELDHPNPVVSSVQTPFLNVTNGPGTVRLCSDSFGDFICFLMLRLY